MATFETYKNFLQPTIHAISTVLELPACIWLLDETDGTLRVAVAAGLSEEYVREARLRLDEPYIASEVFDTGKTKIIEDIEKEALWKYKNDAVRMRLKSAIVMPLKNKNSKVIGIFNVFIPQDKNINLNTLEPKVGFFADQLNAMFIHSDQRKALIEFGRELSKIVEEEKILQSIYDHTSKIMNTENMYIALCEKSKGIVRFKLAYEQDEKKDVSNESREIKDCYRTGWIICNKKSLLFKTYEASQIWYNQPNRHKFHNTKFHSSWLGVPMIAGSDVIGVIGVHHPNKENVYDEDDLEVLLAIATQAAIAIENLRRKHSTLYEISKAAVISDNFITLCKKIQAIIGNLLDAENFRIVSFDFDGKISEYLYYDDKKDTDKEKQKRIIEKGLTGYVFRTGKPFISSPEKRDELINQGKIEEDTGTPSKSWLGVPLRIKEKGGVITVHSYDKEDAYGEAEKDILMFVSEQIAMAIEQVGFHEELNQKNEELKEQSNKLEKINSQHKALINLAQKLTSSIQLNENDILNIIKGQIHGLLMEMDNMYIAIYDEGNNSVRFPLAFKNGQPTEIHARKAGSGRTEEIIRTKQPIFIQTRKESEEWYYEDVEAKTLRPGRSEYMDDPLASWLGVPMMIGDRVLGVVATYHPTKDYVYTEDDLEILQAMANIAAISLDNAGLYSEKEHMLESAFNKIAEAESVLTRSTIAADMVHRLNNLAGTIPIWANLIQENTNQMIGKINKDVEKLIDVAGKLDAEPQKELIDISSVLNPILNQIRIQHRGKIDAGQLTVTEEISPDLYKIRGLSLSVSNAIFNIISNGVESVMSKQAGMLAVKAYNYTDNENSEWVKIEIRDTGRGIPDNIQDKIFMPFFTTKEAGRGYGLWRAKFVIENLGGNISADSQYGKGATFIITLPKATED